MAGNRLIEALRAHSLDQGRQERYAQSKVVYDKDRIAPPEERLMIDGHINHLMGKIDPGAREMASQLMAWEANPITMIARDRGWLPLKNEETMIVRFQGQCFIVTRKDDAHD